jgi:hypothetical protein
MKSVSGEVMAIKMSLVIPVCFRIQFFQDQQCGNMQPHCSQPILATDSDQLTAKAFSGILQTVFFRLAKLLYQVLPCAFTAQQM